MSALRDMLVILNPRTGISANIVSSDAHELGARYRALGWPAYVVLRSRQRSCPCGECTTDRRAIEAQQIAVQEAEQGAYERAHRDAPLV